MWPFGLSERAKAYVEREDVINASANWFHSTKSFARFLTQFSELDAERIIVAFMHQDGSSRYDPIEDSPKHAATFEEVQEIITEEFPEKRRGISYSLWSRKKQLLKERGISWLSPSELNPFNKYD